ncbi:hypothetical protein, partial [Gluconacetobacter diazotrophicus]|uniref:hypothetical protein n=1 Tax=Gluconacetobacter diazotrophicus TaxID=33996 RepID=UPI001C7E29BA
MNAICASEDFDFFMEPSFSRRRDHKWKIPDQSGPNIGRHVKIIRKHPASAAGMFRRLEYDDGALRLSCSMAGVRAGVRRA